MSNSPPIGCDHPWTRTTPAGSTCQLCGNFRPWGQPEAANDVVERVAAAIDRAAWDEDFNDQSDGNKEFVRGVAKAAIAAMNYAGGKPERHIAGASAPVSSCPGQLGDAPNTVPPAPAMGDASTRKDEDDARPVGTTSPSEITDNEVDRAYAAFTKQLKKAGWTDCHGSYIKPEKEAIRAALVAARLEPVLSKVVVWDTKRLAWWKEGAAGYTPNVSEAGRFDPVEIAERNSKLSCRFLVIYPESFNKNFPMA